MNTPSPKYCNPRYALQILQKIHDSGLLSLAAWGADLEIIRIVLSSARPTDAEIAALLRELEQALHSAYPHCLRPGFPVMTPAGKLITRARAMAKRLEPPANG